MTSLIEQTGPNTFTTTHRGVEYAASQVGGRWYVSTQRASLKAARMGGGVKFFNSLADIAAKVKAFEGLDVLVSAEAVQ